MKDSVLRCAVLLVIAGCSTQLDSTNSLPLSVELTAEHGIITLIYEWNCANCSLSIPEFTTVGETPPSNAIVENLYMADSVFVSNGIIINRITLGHNGIFDTVAQTFADGRIVWPTPSSPKLFPFQGQALAGLWQMTPYPVFNESSYLLRIGVAIRWTAPSVVSNVPPILQAPFVDFNGDGQSDVFIYNTSTGNTEIRYGQPGDGLRFAPVSQTTWSLGHKLVPGDFNGDGLTDVLIYNTNTGNTEIRYGQPADGLRFAPASQTTWGLGHKLIPSDFNGDGLSDVLIYITNTGNTEIR